MFLIENYKGSCNLRKLIKINFIFTSTFYEFDMYRTFFSRRREFFQWWRWRNRPWAMTLTPSDSVTQPTVKPWTSPQESKQKRTYILKTWNDFTVIKRAMMLQTFTYKYEHYKWIFKFIRVVLWTVLFNSAKEHVSLLHKMCY